MKKKKEVELAKQKANMLNSTAKTDEKAQLRKKEMELQRLLDEQIEIQKQHLELIEEQKAELEYQKWQMQFEKEYAVKQYMQMIEEHEKEQQRVREEEEKRRADEEWQANEIAEFANRLDQLYDIKEVTEEHLEEVEEHKMSSVNNSRAERDEIMMNDQDIILEDIIDDIAMDALELHDSDDSGADLHEEGLDLDELEEDAIPDDPLEQHNSVIAFEFFGQAPTPSLLSLSPTGKLSQSFL